MSGSQLFQDHLSIPQIRRIEPLGEPFINRSKQIADLPPPSSLVPQTAGEAGRGAKLPHQRTLFTCNRQRPAKASLSLQQPGLRPRRQQLTAKQLRERFGLGQ